MRLLKGRGMRPKPKDVDQYLAALSDDKRGALLKVRQAIRAAAPGAEECISYQMPAFRLDGRVLVWFGAATNHCSLFPGAFPIAAHEEDLQGYDTSKGTVRFDPKRPLPATLVRKLVKARIAEQARSAKRPGIRKRR